MGAVGRHRLAAPAARASTQAGGQARPAGAPRPRRDLRAVRGRRPGRGAARPHQRPRASSAPLRAQEIPADTLAERGVRGDAVRLLTAHRSKGLEWRLVVVAHVQEGAWPDLRRRDSLLQADRIGRRRPAAAADPRRDARRGAPAVLRRLHPRPPAAGRHRGRVARRRRRAALAVRRTSSAPRARAPASGRPAPAAVHGRAGRRAAPHRSPTPTSPSRCARPPPAGCALLAATERARPPGRARRRPRHLVGAARAEPLRAAGPAGRRAGHAVGQRPRRAADLPGPVVPRARGRAAASSARPARASARSSTRSPSGSPRATCADPTRRR